MCVWSSQCPSEDGVLFTSRTAEAACPQPVLPSAGAGKCAHKCVKFCLSKCLSVCGEQTKRQGNYHGTFHLVSVQLSGSTEQLT